MKIKKIVIVLTSILLCLCLVGCGEKEVSLNEWVTLRGNQPANQEISIKVNSIISGDAAEAVLLERHPDATCHLDADVIFYAVNYDVKYSGDVLECTYPIAEIANSVAFDFETTYFPNEIFNSAEKPLHSFDPHLMLIGQTGKLRYEYFDRGLDPDETLVTSEPFLVEDNVQFFVMPMNCRVDTIKFKVVEKEAIIRVD